MWKISLFTSSNLSYRTSLSPLSLSPLFYFVHFATFTIKEVSNAISEEMSSHFQFSDKTLDLWSGIQGICFLDAKNNAFFSHLLQI